MTTLAAGAALAVKAPVRGKGAKKKKKDEDEEVIGEAFSWEDHRETAALRLLEALSLHTGRQSPLPEWTDDGVILGVQGAPSRARI